MTNPFAPQVPAAEQAPAQQAPQAYAAPAPAAGNPFAQQQAPQQQYAPPAPAAPGGGNPFAQQQAPQQAPAGPYGAPQQQVQQWAGTAAYAPPTPVQQAPVQQYAPPAPLPALGQVNAAPPPVVSDGRGAKLADMYGRLVVMFPLSCEQVPRNPQYITPDQRAAGNVNQDRMTVTVVVLDDGQGGMSPIAFGGAPYELPPRPHTESAPLPYVRKGMWINQSRLISQLRPSLPAPGGAPQVVCGRVVKTGPERNAPWYLAPASEQDLALANRYMQGAASGEFPHPFAA